VRRQLPMGQRCGKFSRSARQRTMLVRARSMSSGDSDAISRSFISASVSGSFVIEWSLLRSRSATRGLFRFLSSSRREGTARQGGATNPYVHAFLRRHGAFRRAVRRSPSASGRALQVPVVFAPRFAVPTKSGERTGPGSHAALVGRRAEPRRRPGDGRGRRSVPHEPPQPVRVPHGADNYRYVIL
jgi:hypothetical protein